MDLFEILRGEHNEIRRLLNEVIHQTSVDVPESDRLEKFQDWEDAFNDFKVAIFGHDRAEEATLYHLLRTEGGDIHFADEKAGEHREIEDLIEDLDRINPRDNSWDDKIAILKNQLDAHFREEEKTTFEKARRQLDDRSNSRLTEEFTKLRDDLVASRRYHPKGKSIINPAGLDLN